MRSTIEKYKHLWSYAITAFLASIAAIATTMVLVTFKDLPQIENLKSYTPKGITILLDKNRSKAHEYYKERRIVLQSDQIPDLTKKAFLVAEDWGFYDHFGIDIKGILRAVVANILQGGFSQGASTITQQLSRNLFLSHKKTLARKIKEAYLTLRIERKFTKDEILTLYLNQIYLGEGAYGIEQASQIYFGKSVSQLSIAENALLASLPKNPNIYSPFKNTEKSLSRRNLILQWMQQRGVISEAQMLTAKEVHLPQEKQTTRSKQNYFTYAALEKLQEKIPPHIYENGRLTIQSDYDHALQIQSESAIAKGLQAYMQRHQLHAETNDLPQMASLSMDIHTGHIRAMVGGVDFSQSLYNRALLALRQPGSSIKPLLYALALDRNFTQSSFLLDAPISFHHPKFGRWEPENYDKTYDGYIPLRNSLEKSKNTSTIRLLQEIGIAPFINWLRTLGITTPIETDLTISLGSSSIYLPELATAYATFANGGYRVQPSLIQKVTNHTQDVLYEQTSHAEKVIDPTTAFLITDALTGVIQDGTGSFAKDIPCAIAGKTGTTNQYIDSVFVGYSSDIVTVVWVGFDDNRSLGFGESGSKAAGRIWKDIMQFHCQQDQPGPFLQPKGITWETVDHETGLLPTKYSVNLTRQAYKTGTEPTDQCCKPNYDTPLPQAEKP
ncbi:MAG: PBP1A family penicillin-binding protein [Deltaproteobacteria bacterium]|nr:PBP1A family penicillin-binding protein [Deltaproteobacteria bacterium]